MMFNSVVELMLCCGWLVGGGFLFLPSIEICFISNILVLVKID